MPALMQKATEKLYEFLVETAEHGRRCPSIPQMATYLRLPDGRVVKAYDALKRCGLIKWRVEVSHDAPGKRLRVVTITATGKQTAEAAPARPPKPNKPKGGWLIGWQVDHEPDDLCGGRRLVGAEFMKRKRELEAIDRQQREARAT